MQCREGCGACCIAASIREPFHGMPRGKPAGQHCAHLDEDLRCRLFGDPRRPVACVNFRPEPAVCGDNREQALRLLGELELATLPPREASR